MSERPVRRGRTARPYAPAVADTDQPPFPAGLRPGLAATLLAFALGAVGSGVVAVAWIPLRQSQSSVEVALVLVAWMSLAGASRRRAAVVGAAAGAAVGFTYFDTRPYDHWTIARGPDLATAVTLVVVGILTAELAVRLGRSRHNEAAATVQLARVRDAAALLAHGEEPVVLIGAVAEELAEAAGVAECWFSTEPLPPGTPVVSRDGDVVLGGAHLLAVPVWALGSVVGHFLLRPPPDNAPPAARLRVAVTLADQVGAALAAQAPLPPLPPGTGPDAPPDELRPRLRVVQTGERGEVAATPLEDRLGA